MRTALIFFLLGVTPCLAFDAGDVDRVVRPTCNCIDGVSVGDPNDKSTWRLDFKADATDEQKKAAQDAIDAFDVNAVIEQPKTLEEQVQELQKKLDDLEAAKPLK